jgi:hypothetical protein
MAAAARGLELRKKSSSFSFVKVFAQASKKAKNDTQDANYLYIALSNVLAFNGWGQ